MEESKFTRQKYDSQMTMCIITTVLEKTKDKFHHSAVDNQLSWYRLFHIFLSLVQNVIYLVDSLREDSLPVH